jgi:hypothetical protein
MLQEKMSHNGMLVMATAGASQEPAQDVTMDPSSSQEEGNHVDANDPIYQVSSSPKTALPAELPFWGILAAAVSRWFVPRRCCRTNQTSAIDTEWTSRSRETRRRLAVALQAKVFALDALQVLHMPPAWKQHRWSAGGAAAVGDACARAAPVRRIGSQSPWVESDRQRRVLRRQWCPLPRQHRQCRRCLAQTWRT